MRWSYSKLTSWEQCPAKYNFTYNLGIRDAPGPAASRGSQMHEDLENYLDSDSPPKWMEPHMEHLQPLRHGMREYKIILNADWAKCSDDEIPAFIAIIDLVSLNHGENTALVVDYKSGRRYDSHGDQLHLYALASLAEWPELETVHVANYYLDEPPGGWLRSSYERGDFEIGKMLWEDRLADLKRDTKFQPKPGRHCNWCPASKSKGGPCPVG